MTRAEEVLLLTAAFAALSVAATISFLRKGLDRDR